MIPGRPHPRAPLSHLLGHSQAAPLLTHLRPHRPWLPDVRDRFQEAALTFCLRHDQARCFISQAFQATPEPTGLVTALAGKGRRVRSPGHLREALGGGLGDESTHRLQMLALGDSLLPSEERSTHFRASRMASCSLYLAPDSVGDQVLH